MFHSLQGLINTPMGGQIASMLGNYGLLGGMTQNGANVPVTDAVPSWTRDTGEQGYGGQSAGAASRSDGWM